MLENILLAKRQGRTWRMSALGFDTKDSAQRGPYRKGWGSIFSRKDPEQALQSIRALLDDLLVEKELQKGYPVQYLEIFHRQKKNIPRLMIS